ncbi:MAG: tRNA-guanine transglycosylase [Gammaproteobacteria bacterium]|nr:tRNA-guanine transglycosylase [Gammaproteobacteria bacterium]
MEFEVTHTDGEARRGTLNLSHGQVQTPIFMPCGTYGSVKALAPRTLDEIGVQILLGNTFHLFLRPGTDIIERLGGLARLYELGAADPDRLRRLPRCSRSRVASPDQRARRHVQVSHQWGRDLFVARRIDADSDGAGFRHRHGFRRVHAVPGGEAGRA